MEIYDLTLPFSIDMPVFPGTPSMHVEMTSTVAKDQYNLGLYTINSHAGTHTDAPRHYIADGRTLGEVDLSRYFGYAVIADVRAKGAPGSAITPEDLAPYRDRIAHYKRVILYTGWSSHVGQADYFTDYPVITEECARFLTDLGIVLLGVEAPSMNPAKHLEVHKQFLSHDVAIVEALTGLDQLPCDIMLFSASPLPFYGADGFPVRAFAIEL